MDSEQQAIFVYYENERKKFKMVMKGDIAKLTVEKIKRYLTNATGLPRNEQILSYEGHILTDDLIGEDFGLVSNATLTLAAGVAQVVDDLPVSLNPKRPAPTAPAGGASPGPSSTTSGGPGGVAHTPPSSHPYSAPPHREDPSTSPGISKMSQPNSTRPDFYGERGVPTHAPPAPGGPSSRYPPNDTASTVDGTDYSYAVSSAAAAPPPNTGMLSRNTTLEEENMKLRHELQMMRKEMDHTSRSNRPHDNVLANAKANLVELGNELGLHLAFDANLTCVVGSEEKNTILVTFDAATERLYLYSTLLTYVPEDAAMRLRLYETLLEGALLGRDMAGGGCGISQQSGIVMMSTTIDLKHCDAFALRDATPKFVESLVRWRQTLGDLLVQGPVASGAGSSSHGVSFGAGDAMYHQPGRSAPPPPPSDLVGRGNYY